MSSPTDPSAPPRLFVSHSHEDTAFCREFVAGLRAHQLDVWYDEHNLGWGMLHQEISHQLDTRDGFIVILSPAAVASRWVNREIGAALDLEAEGRITSFIIVIATPCDIPGLLRGYRRIQATAGAPLSAPEAAERTYRAVLNENANTHNATSAVPMEPAAPANAPFPSDAGVVDSPSPERKLPSIIAPSDATQSAPPDTPQTPPPATATGTPPVKPSPAPTRLRDMSPEERRKVIVAMRKSFPQPDPSPEALQEMVDEVAERLRQAGLGAAVPPTPSSRQQLPIPSAPISLPPDRFPDRLARLGFVPHRGSDLTTIRVPIPNEDMKGRLIGREGRNLRAFEEATGVTLTVDDTPEVVTLSSATPALRQIARDALIKLVADGRIHPTSIEAAVAECRREAAGAPPESLEGEYILPPLCTVPAGPFQMGSDPKRDPDARPNEHVQTVNLPAFQIARYPVSVAEYACFVRAGHVAPRKGTYGIEWSEQLQRLDHPTTCVTWHDATAYAAWLARLTGQPWRLPDEEEWEKAARWHPQTNTIHIYPWGNTFEGRCNTSESRNGTTTPVGTYRIAGASPCGVEDMAGNVWEWTSSLYRKSNYDRVLRGGSWDDLSQDARAACRHHGAPSSFFGTVGFRLVLASPTP